MRLLGSLLGCGTRPGTKKVASTPTTSPSDDGVDSIDDWELKERCISVFYKVCITHTKKSAPKNRGISADTMLEWRACGGPVVSPTQD